EDIKTRRSAKGSTAWALRMPFFRNSLVAQRNGKLSPWVTLGLPAAVALRGDLDLGRLSRGVAARTAAPPGLYECRFSTTRWLLSTTVNCHLGSPRLAFLQSRQLLS